MPCSYDSSMSHRQCLNSMQMHQCMTCGFYIANVGMVMEPKRSQCNVAYGPPLHAQHPRPSIRPLGSANGSHSINILRFVFMVPVDSRALACTC